MEIAGVARRFVSAGRLPGPADVATAGLAADQRLDTVDNLVETSRGAVDRLGGGWDDADSSPPAVLQTQ